MIAEYYRAISRNIAHQLVSVQHACAAEVESRNWRSRRGTQLALLAALREVHSHVRLLHRVEAQQERDERRLVNNGTSTLPWTGARR